MTTRTTICFVHLFVLARIDQRETIEVDFQQRALNELQELGLVEGVHETRPFGNGAPRLRATITARGASAILESVAAVARWARAEEHEQEGR